MGRDLPRVLMGDCGAQVQNLPGEPAPRHALRDLPRGDGNVHIAQGHLCYPEPWEAG